MESQNTDFRARVLLGLLYKFPGAGGPRSYKGELFIQVLRSMEDHDRAVEIDGQKYITPRYSAWITKKWLATQRPSAKKHLQEAGKYFLSWKRDEIGYLVSLNEIALDENPIERLMELEAKKQAQEAEWNRQAREREDREHEERVRQKSEQMVARVERLIRMVLEIEGQGWTPTEQQLEFFGETFDTWINESSWGCHLGMGEMLDQALRNIRSNVNLFSRRLEQDSGLT